MERYISFMISNLVFIDSFQFMSRSLAELAKTVPKENFHHIKNQFGIEDLELITKKGIYPYDYKDSFERFKETKLPPKSKFYSKLDDVNISDDDYAHAKKVWDTFKCKTMGDYHDLYLVTDVLLLADIFETFRKNMHGIL